MASLLRMQSVGSPLSPLNAGRFRKFDTAVDDVTVVQYGDMEDRAHWLSPSYLDLHLKCAGLIANEASQALKQHFQKSKATRNSSRLPERIPFQRVLEQEEKLLKGVPYRDNFRQWKQLSSPIIWDPSLESSLVASALLDSTDHRHSYSFLEESFC